jgi:hypothetical protein
MDLVLRAQKLADGLRGVTQFESTSCDQWQGELVYFMTSFLSRSWRSAMQDHAIFRDSEKLTRLLGTAERSA